MSGEMMGYTLVGYHRIGYRRLPVLAGSPPCFSFRAQPLTPSVAALSGTCDPVRTWLSSLDGRPTLQGPVRVESGRLGDLDRARQRLPPLGPGDHYVDVAAAAPIPDARRSGVP